MPTVESEKEKLILKIYDVEAKFKARFGTKYYRKKYESGHQTLTTCFLWGFERGETGLFFSTENAQDDCETRIRLVKASNAELLLWSDRILDFWDYCEQEETKDIAPYQERISKLKNWLEQSK